MILSVSKLRTRGDQRSWWRARVAVSFVPGRSAVACQAAGQWYLFGNEAFKRREYDQAISYYERALEVRQRTPDIYFNLGHSYAQVGRFVYAAEAMKRAAAINPTDHVARQFASEYAKRTSGR